MAGHGRQLMHQALAGDPFVRTAVVGAIDVRILPGLELQTAQSSGPPSPLQTHTQFGSRASVTH